MMDTAVMDPPTSELPDDQHKQNGDGKHDEPAAEQTTRPNSPPPPTAEEIARYKQEHYEAIREEEVRVRILEGNYNGLKEEANDAKKAFEAADKSLRFLISRGYEVPKKWPTRVRAIANLIAPKIEFGQEFDVLEINEHQQTVRVLIDAEETPAGDWLPIGKEVEVIAWGERPMPPPEPVETPDESWKEVPAAGALWLTASQAEKFAQAGVETMGQFEKLRADIADGKASWPKGIGEAQRTKLIDAAIGWLRTWHRIVARLDEEEIERKRREELMRRIG